MYFEVIGFTPSISGNTIVLDDENLYVDFVYIQVSKNGSNINGSQGFAAGSKKRNMFNLSETAIDSGRSSSYMILHKRNNSGVPATALAGNLASGWGTVAGELPFEFDTVYDSSYSIDGFVIGHH